MKCKYCETEHDGVCNPDNRNSGRKIANLKAKLTEAEARERELRRALEEVEYAARLNGEYGIERLAFAARTKHSDQKVNDAVDKLNQAICEKEPNNG